MRRYISIPALRRGVTQRTGLRSDGSPIFRICVLWFVSWETIQVKAVRPERDALEIRFPRVEGYRVELPEERLEAKFDDDSILELTPELTGPSITRNSGIIGLGVDLTLDHLQPARTDILPAEEKPVTAP